MFLKANKMYMVNRLYTVKEKMEIYSNDMIKECFDKKSKMKEYIYHS